MSITLDIIEGPNATRDDDHGWEHYAYTVRLRRAGHTLTVPWMQGLGITEDPNPVDVLEALLLDACGYENATGFEGWASEYGYDEDSRAAAKTYRAVETQTRKLKRFLGRDYDACDGVDARESAYWLVRG